MGLHITLLTQESWASSLKGKVSQLFLHFPFVMDNERIGALTSVDVITKGEVTMSTASYPVALRSLCAAHQSQT